MEMNNKSKHDFFKLYDTFLKETANGRRLQKNGKRVRLPSIQPYVYLRKLLYDFSVKKEFPLHVSSVTLFKKRQLQSEKKYWAKFYKKFSDYLYDDCDCYDNYVGSNMKRLRAFFNYLNEEKEMNAGNFHKKFYTCTEEIDIVTLIPEQLNFLIYNKAFEDGLPDYLKQTKDMFVFGCTVALRLSDIFKLSAANIETLNGKQYLRVLSQKTSTFTRVILPWYAVEIMRRRKDSKTIFPKISKGRFNLNVKSLIELTGWTEERIKIRQKRGQQVIVYKNKTAKEPYRFCDLITSHTMRRTAITTMLCLHMPENLVRKISGHAPNSKEFFRYVQLSQKFMDEETEKVFEQLKTRELVCA